MTNKSIVFLLMLAMSLAIGCVENAAFTPEELNSYRDQTISPNLTYIEIEKNQVLTFIIPTQTPVPMISDDIIWITYIDGTEYVKGRYNVVSTEEGIRVATKSEIKIKNEPQITVGYVRKEIGGELYLVQI